MKEWFVQNFDAAAITGIIVAITSLVSAIAGVVVAIKQTHNSNKFLEDAKKRGTWTKCPHCDKVIGLTELHWRLGNGEPDDNLNGVPDSQERF